MKRIEAQIDWDYLDTIHGRILLKAINDVVKRTTFPLSCKVGIDCPFMGGTDIGCYDGCGLIFKNHWGYNDCPCHLFKAPEQLIVILSDYYDMVKDEEI